MTTKAKTRLIILSGCSGGGKSTILQALQHQGYSVMPEVGREIVSYQQAIGGQALPGKHAGEFARLLVQASYDRYQAALAINNAKNNLIFFDRSLIDAMSYYKSLDLPDAPDYLLTTCRYDQMVFLVPPWPEIYAPDQERQHGFQAAEAEYHRLLIDFAKYGYSIHILAKTTVVKRCDEILRALNIAT